MSKGAFAQTPLLRPAQVQNVTANSADIIWKSTTGGSSQIKYGTTTSYELGTASGATGRRNIDGSPGFFHKVTVSGLSADQKYFYQVISNGAQLTPTGDQNHYIKTSPVFGSSTPFSFVVIGDSGKGNSSQSAVATQIVNKRPELVIEAGDVAYGAGYGGFASLTGEPQQDAFHFDIYKDSMKFSPYYLACGNHDNNENNTPAGIKNGCDIMVDEHSMPNGGRVPQASGTFDDVIYSFNYGNVHFTILNVNPESSTTYTSPTSGSQQALWAYNDIKNSNMPWKVVVWHNNAWSTGSHAVHTGTVNGAAKMAQDAGAHVVLWGHSHVYERMGRYAAQGVAGCTTAGGCRNRGPYYYTIGNSGSGSAAASCGSFTNGPQCIAASGIGSVPSGVGLLHVQVNGSSMTFNYLTSSGAQADSVTYNLSEFGSVPTSPPTSPTRTPTVGGPTPTRTRTPTQGVIPTQPPGGVCTYFKN